MSSQQAVFKRNHFIDSLRFISIFLVLLHHFNIPYKLFDTSINFQIFGESFTTLLARNGNYGVTMFFVISGYLITSHSIQRWGNLKNIHSKDFYLARFARIVPTLILLIALVNFLGALEIKPFMTQAPNGIVVPQLMVNLAALTFWMNLLIIDNGWVNYVLGVLWSLSVEEVFYLVFPLAVLILKRDKFFVLACFALICFSPYFRYLHYGDESEAYLYHYFASFDGIAFGCLAALFIPKIQLKPTINTLLKYLTIACMLWVYFSAPIKENCIFGVTTFSLGTVLFILTHLNSTQASKRPSVLLQYARKIGQNSYEIYLFHLVILGFIKFFYTPALTQGNLKLVLMIIYFLGSIIIGTLIARYFSNPLNQKIRQYWIKQ